MNLKCLAVSAFVAIGIGGSYCVESNAVGNDLKNQKARSLELICESLDYEIAPTGVMVNTSTEISSTEPNTFLQAYFYGLHKNMGENYKGSCGYVALGMLLSYYDTYLDDGIIAEQYDVASIGTEYDMVTRHNSPGIYNDIIPNGPGMSPQEYLTTISSQVDYSLHAKLICMGKDKGYYNFNDDEPCGTTLKQRKAILTSYLAERGLSSNDYSIITREKSLFGWGVSSNDIKEFVKSYIDKGYPVLIGVENTEKGSGHACIAYSYDEKDIYVNMGWSGGYEHYPLSSRYNAFKSAMVIDWKIGHVHSNNYGVSKKNIDGSISVKYYCYDADDIVTIGHRHIYNYEYAQYNDTYHKAYCSCGDSILEEHSYDNATPVNLLYLKNSCKKCGYFKTGGGGSEIV